MANYYAILIANASGYLDVHLRNDTNERKSFLKHLTSLQNKRDGAFCDSYHRCNVNVTDVTQQQRETSLASCYAAVMSIWFLDPARDTFIVSLILLFNKHIAKNLKKNKTKTTKRTSDQAKKQNR